MEHHSPSRLRHIPALRGAVSKHNHQELVTCFSINRNSCLFTRVDCGCYCGFDSGTEAKLEIRLHFDGFGHAWYFYTQLCSWSDTGVDLCAHSLLATTFTLGRISQPESRFAGTYTFGALHGLHRAADARGNARSAPVRLHPHCASERAQ